MESNQENKSLDEERNMIIAEAKKLNEIGKRALIVIPEGTEVSEVVQMADVMRRAGINVVIASLDGSDCVRTSTDVMCNVDAALSDALKEPPFDVLVLPGGLLGAKLLGESKTVGALLKEYEVSRKWIVAIGDAPPVLRKHFIGTGKTLTCHPLIKHKIEGSEYMKYKYIDDDVFVDGKIITCKGGPHTTQCALNLVHLVCGRSIAENVAKKLLIEYDDGYCRDCCGSCKYCCREDKKEIEPDIADRFACSTCCSADDRDVVEWVEEKMFADIMEKEAMIEYKLRREELKDIDEDMRKEEEDFERQIKEDKEELEKWKEKWQNGRCVLETESDKYKREYVERKEESYNARMERKYNRQYERHERLKRRRNMVNVFRNLEADEIDAILAKMNLEQNL